MSKRVRVSLVALSVSVICVAVFLLFAEFYHVDYGRGALVEPAYPPIPGDYNKILATADASLKLSYQVGGAFAGSDVFSAVEAPIRRLMPDTDVKIRYYLDGTEVDGPPVTIDSQKELDDFMEGKKPQVHGMTFPEKESQTSDGLVNLSNLSYDLITPFDHAIYYPLKKELHLYLTIPSK